MSMPMIDGFEDLSLVGRGGFSVVYRARQVAFDRPVAIKVMRTPDDDTLDLAGFERECAAIGTLDWCPNIVTVYAVGVSDAHEPYIVMEYAEGGSLATQLKAAGALTSGATAELGAKIARALQVAHDAGILHRDVKPGNILLSRGGEPLLADFGVARLSDATRTHGLDITGTIAHAAPEVLQGRDHTVASDIYALGSTLFTLVAGRAPFGPNDGADAAQVIARALTAPLPDPRDFGADEGLALVIERAMARNPAERFESARAMASALADVAVATGSRVAPLRAPMTVGHGAQSPLAFESFDDYDDATPNPTATIGWAPVAVSTCTDVTLTDRAGPPELPVLPILPPVEVPAGSSRRPGRTRRFVALAVVLAAILTVGTLAVVFRPKSKPARAHASTVTTSKPVVAPPPVPKFQFGFRGLLFDNQKLYFVQEWQVPASGTSLHVTLALQNLTAAPISYPLHVVVPKSLAHNVDAVRWGQGYSKVVHADPVVMYQLAVPAHGTQHLDYTITIKQATAALFKKWRADEIAAQKLDFAETKTKPVAPKLALTLSSSSCAIAPLQACQLSLDTNRTMQLVAHVTADAKPVSGAGVVFSSSNTGIVRVDNTGLVTALADGDAVISATVGDAADKLSAAVAIHVTGGAKPGPPVAAFSCVPNQLAVQCDGTSSFDPSGAALAYDWSFGDGARSSAPAAAHTYARSGTYSVTLTVHDAAGVSGSTAQSVTVTKINAAPTASFVCSTAGVSVQCNASRSSDSDGSIRQYAWSFGDGGRSTGVNGAHTYAASGHYAVQLTVTDDGGKTGSVVHTVTVVKPNVVPTGDFNSNVNSSHVDFTASGSDPDGDALQYTWSFGDGATATGKTTAHDYSSPGTYTVALAISDGRGGVAHASHPVSINAPPTGDFNVTPTGLHVDVAASASDPDGDPLRYSWDFGDGTPAASGGASSAHDYAAGGTYTITLTIDDGRGGVATVSHQVTVAPVNTPPTGTFTSVVLALHVDFVAVATDLDGDTLQYSWDFGDGTTAANAGAAASHDYTTAGTYTVVLTIDDGQGNSITVTNDVVVS